LSCLFESIDPQLILENHLKIIKFCQLVFEKIVLLMEHDLENDEHELIHLIFSIISVFTTTHIIEIDYEIKKMLNQIFLPLILKFKQLNSNSDLNEMADALYTNLATFGATSKLEENKENQNKKNQINNKHLLIEEVDDSEFKSCLKDINDPLVPVRAHGLVTLRKLIEKRDSTVIVASNLSLALDVCIKNLKFEDSYVYLAAINALIALADYKPDLLMDILIEQVS
jgi:hypothetical protein